MDSFAPVHPGEILKEEFLHPMGISQNKLALSLRVPAQRISAIIAGKRAVTVDTAMRLAAFFGTSPQFWLNLQNRYDLDVAEDEGLPEIIKRDVVGLNETAS